MQRFKKIKLTQGKYALVDAEDYEWLSQWKWFFDIRKGDKTGYAFRNTRVGEGPRRRIRMHNEILGARNIDHANGNGIDNRKNNLRPASRSQQAFNKGVHEHKKSLGCKGVSVVKDKKGIPSYWIARITVEKKRIYLGVFKNHIAASRAYIKAAKKYHGEFARWK